MARTRRTGSAAVPLIAALLYGGTAAGQAPGSAQSGQATPLSVQVGVDQTAAAHQVELALDGQPLQGSVEEGFVAQVPPGRHELQLRIVRSDPGGEVPYERTLTLEVPAGQPAQLALDVQPPRADTAGAMVVDVRAQPETLVAAEDAQAGRETGGFGGGVDEGPRAVPLPMPWPQSVVVPRADTGVAGAPTGGELEPPPGSEPPPELVGEPTRPAGQPGPEEPPPGSEPPPESVGELTKPSQPSGQATAPGQSPTTSQPQASSRPTPSTPTSKPAPGGEQPVVRAPEEGADPSTREPPANADEDAREARIEPPDGAAPQASGKPPPTAPETAPPAVAQRPEVPPPAQRPAPQAERSRPRESPPPRAGRTPLRNERQRAIERAEGAAPQPETGVTGRLAFSLLAIAVAAGLLFFLVRRRRASGRGSTP